MINRLLTRLLIATAAIGCLTTGSAQDRLKSMSGYERYQRVSREGGSSVSGGAVSVTWKDDGKAFEFSRGGKKFRYDIAHRTATELAPTNTTGTTNEPTFQITSSGRRRELRVARGRQYTNAYSPDGKWKAFHRDRNVWLSDTNGSNAVAITTEGNEKARIKLGSASWTYGEELYQNTAMWWSSNSQKLAFYRFDESKVPDYYLTLSHTKLLTTLDTEPYVKAGGTNPVVDLFIYDLVSKQTTRVDARDGEPFTDSSVGHYLYGVSWTEDNQELLFHRTNRRQNVMELVAADPESGKCRVIVREEWLPSWTDNSPMFRFLKDGKRFIWSSERTGWKNFYLYDLGGTNSASPTNARLLATLTKHGFEVDDIVRIDEKRGELFYTARSGENPMKLQLHRVSLDGDGDVRLTDPELHHAADVAPDGKHFIDVAQTHDTPPSTRLMTRDGKRVTELAKSDMTKFDSLKLKRVELLKFKAADDTTDLYGLLHFPSDFNPRLKYPVLVNVYAGPSTTGARESFTTPNALTEFGFLVASFDSRSASGRGKRFLDTIYEKLGTVEIDDQAAGVRALARRIYVNRKRVGIHGTSYGGTAAALCLMRYPDVFHAASASSSVVDFRNYDSIYTERYMWLPQENKAGYDKTSPITYAKNMQGALILFYGTADDNVHPSNTLQLVKELQRLGKSFELQVGPDVGHAAVNRERMMEFFIQNLK
ncbi:MAG TPA: DPP IV N-terminal domain-containing protein [Candidatus Acidoferrum sp.]|nr:DPP IV N-terminal domain-containing protein [Candidatus Acidoferrum sp.]